MSPLGDADRSSHLPHAREKKSSLVTRVEGIVEQWKSETD
jgi:hypothetical protein